MDVDRQIEEMGDVYALLTARLSDDKDAYRQVLMGAEDGDGDDGSGHTIGLILALTDLALGLLTEKAISAGCSTTHLIRSMAMITRVMGPELIEKMERGY